VYSPSKCSIDISASFWLATDTYSPTAIEKAPAAIAAKPAINIVCLLTPAPVTPRIRLAVEMIPSFAPKTAARNLFKPLAEIPTGCFTLLVYNISCMFNTLIIPFLADTLLIVLVIIATCLLLFFPTKPRLQAYSRVLIAGLTTYLIAKLLGSVFQPEDLRPFEKLGVEAGASYLKNPGFPSDHMLLAVSLVYAVWSETSRKNWTIALAVMAVLVGLGRVLALVHTPLDVIGATVIATVGAIWYLQQPTTHALKKSRTISKKSV
jgi:membrane-associated phospholipid phosphatase